MTDIRFATPGEAEEAFYAAFERADLGAMMAVWAHEDSIACVHPTGERLDGFEAVQNSWRKVLGAGTAMRFHISHAKYIQGPALAVHMVHENILVDGGSETPSVVLATNIYQLTKEGWRMILHHASLQPTTSRPTPSTPGVLH
jgi:ketosteroid isomerase-like protein